jgi:hypothetical protein
MFTTRPPDFIRGRAAAFRKFQVPLRFTATTRSKSSSLMRRRSWSRVIPALFTSTSSPPSSVWISAASAATAAVLATSQP